MEPSLEMERPARARVTFGAPPSGSDTRDPKREETCMDKKTLLLTPYYLPIKILRWQDAIKMRYEGTADVIAEY